MWNDFLTPVIPASFLSGDGAANIIIFVTGAVFVVWGSVFFLCAYLGITKTLPTNRTSLGNALGHVCGSVWITMWLLAIFFVARGLNGPEPPPIIKPMWIDTMIRALILFTSAWGFIASLIALPLLLERAGIVVTRTRHRIIAAAIFGALVVISVLAIT